MSRGRLKWRYLPICFFLLLAATVLWDWFSLIKDEDVLIRRVERVLHARERYADNFLNSLDTLEDYTNVSLPQDISLIVIQDSNIISWSSSTVCAPELPLLLSTGDKFLYINNGYYDIRHRKVWDTDCYALINVRTKYKEQNTAFREGFPEVYKISNENAEQLLLLPAKQQEEGVISNIEGVPLFKIKAPHGFKDRSINYWLLACYFILFIIIFVIYDYAMQVTKRVVNQILIFVGFLLFMILAFILLVHFKIPDSIFRLELFQRDPGNSNFVSIGELLIYIFSIFQLMAISIYRFKSNRKLLIPYRYYITSAWIIFVYLYSSLYSYVIRELINHNDVCMNIAAVIDIGMASWIAYLVVGMGAIALIVASDRVFTVFRDFISFKEVMLTIFVTSLVIFLMCFTEWSLLNIYEWLVYVAIMTLLIVNRYVLKVDQQRLMYLFVFVILSFYLLFLLRHYESKKELATRIEIAESLVANREIGGERLLNEGYSGFLIELDNENRNYGFYSYAIYGKNGVLQANHGDYVYNKNIRDWVPVSMQGISIDYEGYNHILYSVESGQTIVVSLPSYYFNSFYYLNLLYLLVILITIGSYNLIYHLNIFEPFAGKSIKVRVKQSINLLIGVLFLVLTLTTLAINHRNYNSRERDNTVRILQQVTQQLEIDGARIPSDKLGDRVNDIASILRCDINLYEASSGKLIATSSPEIFSRGYLGYWVNPKARMAILSEGENNVMLTESIADMEYISVYAPLNVWGENYIVNVPYFAEAGGYDRELATLLVILVNIVIVLIMLSFSISEWIANWMLHPLILVTENLKRMKLVDRNEKIIYDKEDEVGILVSQYNDTIDMLDESVKLLAKSEREGAWREMARQIAHEIKNPLTPMKLNIQLLQRSVEVEDYNSFKQRFNALSQVIMEQIDSMAATATAFSDFAKIPKLREENFDLVQLIRNLVLLYNSSTIKFIAELPQSLWINSDRVLIGRVLTNLIKNSCQSIPEDREGLISLSCAIDNKNELKIVVKDNGSGIDVDTQKKIFEPSFTTKSNGMGLGLAISKRIVETLDGDITFSSILNKGTEFVVILRNVKRVDSYEETYS